MKLYDYEKEHIHAIRELLPECTVLLKKDGRFPIDKPCEIALYGEGVRHTIKGGTGSGDVNSRYFVTVEKGFQNAGFSITTHEWLDAYDEILAQAKEEFLKEIKERARKNHTLAVMEGMGAVMKASEYELPLSSEGDAAIYVLSRNSGEGNDRDFVKGDILLTDTEIRDILILNDMYETFMLVLNVGGPVDLSPVKEVKNILLLSQLGVETGNILAAIVLGKMNPSGKLTTSWAYEKDIPRIGGFGNKEETRYKEGIYVGYRYYDSVGIKNDFPFGFGLSYTDFHITCKEIKSKRGQVTVMANVENIGEYAGKEAVQLYVSMPSGKLDQPHHVLAAFAKTNEIEPGQSRVVTLEFALKDLAGYDEEISAYILEKGDYILCLGDSSVNTAVCGILKLSENHITLQARKCCGEPDFTDWKPDNLKQIESIEFCEDDPKKQDVNYDLDEEIDPFIDKLSDEELAYVGIGHFNPKAGMMSVIGSASSRVAGAAGETTDILEGKGFPVLVMADGPAGLRLSQKYATADGKAYALGATLPAGIEEFLPKPATMLLKMMNKKPPKDATYGEQYATAIPIGTAIAQSFNYELARKLGDIVGDEMERFGVHLWLAPALNIHRSIRCGRNFEYYSEDPLVSGMMAAALTEGVQSHKGCGVTIKHYAANNQETSRYTNNSQVSERTMREIYLKGFGICVKKAHPQAVMTSYNLLNGIHTAERRDLIQDILRCEFGFDGIVMTDWIISMMKEKNSKYDVAHSAKVAEAGGDLFMPGCKADYEQLLSAIKNGSISRKQMKINATRVYKLSKER